MFRLFNFSKKILKYGKEQKLKSFKNNHMTGFTKNILQSVYIVDFIEGIRIDKKQNMNIYVGVYSCSGKKKSDTQIEIEPGTNDKELNILTNTNAQCDGGINVLQRNKFVVSNKDEQVITLKMLNGICNAKDIYHNLEDKGLIPEDLSNKVYTTCKEQSFKEFIYLTFAGYSRYSDELISKQLAADIFDIMSTDLNISGLDDLCLEAA